MCPLGIVTDDFPTQTAYYAEKKLPFDDVNIMEEFLANMGKYTAWIPINLI